MFNSLSKVAATTAIITSQVDASASKVASKAHSQPTADFPTLTSCLCICNGSVRDVCKCYADADAQPHVPGTTNWWCDFYWTDVSCPNDPDSSRADEPIYSFADVEKCWKEESLEIKINKAKKDRAEKAEEADRAEKADRAKFFTPETPTPTPETN